MQKPDPHPDEKRRLDAVRALRLLDTPIEERFERITRSAKQLLQVPIVALTLVDAERQWFKSVHGLDAAETSRHDSFCGHAILGKDTFVVSDARRDERFSDNPLVTGDPWIRFYAGHPLLSADGLPLGTLCVADRRKRSFNDKHAALLKTLALAAEAELRVPSPAKSQRELAQELARTRGAAVDSLTRLWGREAILDILEREFQHARKKGTGIGTIIVELDSRERIAEDHGYAASDTVIRKTARRLLRTLRPQDAVGRFGGGEFLGVVTTPDRAELAALAQRMRARVARTPVKSGKDAVDVTVSLGAAWAPASDLRTPGALLDAANYALCNAQQRGGNRVEVRAA
ncbi:MAG TPA: sensor domain-containing diguanylate cyclase [Verrucomicrobiae bacterium]|nr:sensor domain-containing diguanylate cyclase [Verrucomicrobiae bacterium]